MGSKKVLPAHSILTSGVMSGTSTINSSVTNIQNLDNVGLDISWTGTAVGTITVNCSLTETGTFRALTFDPPLTQPAGSAGGYLVSLQQVPFPWIKVSYTNASSSGVLNVSIFAKDLN